MVFKLDRSLLNQEKEPWVQKRWHGPHSPDDEDDDAISCLHSSQHRGAGIPEMLATLKLPWQWQTMDQSRGSSPWHDGILTSTHLTQCPQYLKWHLFLPLIGLVLQILFLHWSAPSILPEASIQDSFFFFFNVPWIALIFEISFP